MPPAWSTRHSTAVRCGWCRRRKASPSPLCSTAHRRAAAAGREDFTDDAALAEWAGLKVSVFAGEPGNIKITNEGDFARAEATQFARAWRRAHRHRHRRARLRAPAITSPSAAFASRIAQALTGHSDADVVLHALTDAILGALADGDIGVHFPPSDPQWRGASSDRFLAFAVERLAARGGRIAHLDINIVCEAPRIGPHRDAMRANIARLAGIDAAALR